MPLQKEGFVESFKKSISYSYTSPLAWFIAVMCAASLIVGAILAFFVLNDNDSEGDVMAPEKNVSISESADKAIGAS